MQSYLLHHIGSVCNTGSVENDTIRYWPTQAGSQPVLSVILLLLLLLLTSDSYLWKCNTAVAAGSNNSNIAVTAGSNSSNTAVTAGSNSSNTAVAAVTANFQLVHIPVKFYCDGCIF